MSIGKWGGALFGDMMIGMTDELRTLLDQVADAALQREPPHGIKR